MAYPNLVAEYNATYVSTRILAQYANVTEELLQDVLDGNEELTHQEKLGILRCFRIYDVRSFSYLFSPALGVIDAQKNNRHKVKLLELEALAERARPCAPSNNAAMAKSPIAHELQRDFEWCIRVVDDAKRTKIKYAFYRYAVHQLNFLIECHAAATMERNPRGRTSAETEGAA